MAKINLERRAEIGAEKRAKTRAQILELLRIAFLNEPCMSFFSVDKIAY